MTFLARTAAIATFLLPSIGHAEQINASDGTSIANFFVAEGFSPELTADSGGDPKVSVEYYGTKVVIYFYGCQDNRNCTSIQLFSGYRTEGSVRMNKINEWNTGKRFARAYISDSGSARIEHDMYLGRNGLDADDFAQMLSLWLQAVRQFEEHIDW